MKIPVQFYIFAMVLSLYYWPWQLSFFNADADALLTVISLQLAFVMLCNKLTRESWATAIIIVEGFCMMLNIVYALNGATLFYNHADIMRTAFIIELLIISMSMGAVVGRNNSNRLQIYGDSLRAISFRNHASKNREASAQ